MKKELPKVEPVKIKPLFGLKPGLWLTIAYAIALILIVFIVGFLPDILDSSKRVTFTSQAGTVAVYVDDIYQGGTPFTRKIASGNHNVSYKVNGQEIDNFNLKVSHPVFFNWLFPRTQTVNSTATLTQAAFEALTAQLLQDANSYSAILEYTSTHRYANIFTSYANAIVNSPFKNNTKVLEAAFDFISTTEMYNDALNACQILGLNTNLNYSKLNTNSVIGITETKPELKATKKDLVTEIFTIEGYAIPQATFSNGRQVNNTYPEVQEAGVITTTEAFNISTYCITESQFAYFVQACPDWALNNKENLKAQGLVDDYYLDGVSLNTTVKTNKPVRNISYYAAQAYCQWLSSITGLNVTLPTENQWIAASFTDEGYQKSLMPSNAENSPSAMLGGVWEMTSTNYVPLSRISNNDISPILAQYNTQTDMIVKGGSYVNKPSEIDNYSVGVTYRSLCSDYMGFRVVWN